MFPSSYFPSSFFSGSFFAMADAGGGSGGSSGGTGEWPIVGCPRPAADPYLFGLGQAFRSSNSEGTDIYTPIGPGKGFQSMEEVVHAQDPIAFALAFPTAYLTDPVDPTEYTTSDTTDGDVTNNRLPGWDYEHSTPSKYDRYWIAVDRYGAYVTANEWAHGVGFHDAIHGVAGSDGPTVPYDQVLSRTGAPNGAVFIQSNVEANFARLLDVGGGSIISIHPDKPQNFEDLLRMARTRAHAMFRWRRVTFDLTYGGVVDVSAQDPAQSGVLAENYPFTEYPSYNAISGYIDFIEITHDADSDGRSLPATRIRSYPPNAFPLRVIGESTGGGCTVPPIPIVSVARTKAAGIDPASASGDAISPAVGTVQRIGPDGKPEDEDTYVENYLGAIRPNSTVILVTNPCDVPIVVAEACAPDWDSSSSDPVTSGA
jgi:hypothetical protein